MNKIKILLAKNFQGFTFFYGFLGKKIFIALILSIFVGILDGFGLSMFLPLLQLINDTGTVDADSVGRLGFLITFLTSLGFDLNIVTILIFLCLLFIFKGVLKFGYEVYRVVIQGFFIKKLRLILVSLMNKISYKYYVGSDIGRIQNTMSGEVERVNKAFGSYFKAMEQLILTIVYMGFAFFIDVRFAFLVTVGGVIINFLYKTIYTATKTTSRQFTTDSNYYQGLIIQYVANYKYLKSTGYVSRYGKKLSNTIADLYRSDVKIGKLGAIVISSREPLLIIVVAVTILIQTQLFDSALGPIILSLLFFYRALTALMGMQTAWNYYLGNSGSIDNMKDFIAELESNKVIDNGEIEIDYQSKIKFDNVSFNYEENQVLKNVNLVIQKNTTVAFVGQSGSGKTTLMNLITGLLPANSGEILIDETSLRKINLESFRKNFGYITQDPIIFNDTIYNNITMWDELSTKNLKSFETAANEAVITDFMSSLPNGRDTILGNNGVNLSGGQKQRISIARELYKDVSILIMDEATSALDSETEKSIQTNIDNLKGHYTILIVAHRLSTIKNCDQIVLLNEGNIEGTGNYQELLSSSEKFMNMVKMQEL